MPLFAKCLTFTIRGAAQTGSEAFCLSGEACVLLKTAWLSRCASWVPGRRERRERRASHEHLQHPWDEQRSGSWQSHLIPLRLSFPPQKMDHLFCLQALQDTYHVRGADSPKEPGFDLIWGSEEPL